MNWLDKQKRKRNGGRLKIEMLMASPIEKSRLWQKHDITVRPKRSFCHWHFVGNMFQRCRCWDKCWTQKHRQFGKSPNVKFDTNIENRIVTRYRCVSSNTFWYTSTPFFELVHRPAVFLILVALLTTLIGQPHTIGSCSWPTRLQLHVKLSIASPTRLQLHVKLSIAS